MDEEELEQSGKKITIGNFFDSIVRIDRMADRAFKTSSTNVILTKQNSSLIKALESKQNLPEAPWYTSLEYFEIVKKDLKKVDICSNMGPQSWSMLLD